MSVDGHDAQVGRPRAVARRPASPQRRAAMGAAAVLLLAVLAGDPRVILVGIPAAIALGLAVWAERRQA